MTDKLLTFKDTKRGIRFCFNPFMVASISDDHRTEGAIYICMMGDGEDGFIVNYPYEDAIKQWQEVINT